MSRPDWQATTPEPGVELQYRPSIESAGVGNDWRALALAWGRGTLAGVGEVTVSGGRKAALEVAWA